MLAQQRRSTRKSIAVLPLNSPSINEFTPITKRRSVVPSLQVGSIACKALFSPKTPSFLTPNPATRVKIDSTPITNFINHQTTPKTTYLDPVMARIKRDMNSPSAQTRMKASKALKSPSFKEKTYGLFDVPHERQDLLTEEERRPLKPKSIEEVFRNCKIYVEVRTGDDNRSAGIKNRLLRDGIVVNEKLYKDTTHVIFKDGLLSTYNKAIKLSIPVTTILWIDSCIGQRRLVDTLKFKISNLDRYEHPELYKRLRRQKSMQPDLPMMFETPTRNKLDRSFSQDDSRDHVKNFDNETIHEVSGSCVGMELTLQPSISNCESPMNGMAKRACDKLANDMRRLTTFTPNQMEQTGIAAKLTFERRRTIFTPQLSSQETVQSPAGLNTSKPLFSSINKIGNQTRRSVFDISMNILEMHCKAMSQQKQNDPKDTENTPVRSQSSTSEEPFLQMHQTQIAKSTAGIVRKRKLFTSDGLDQTEEFKENQIDRSVKLYEKKSKNESLVKQWITPQMEKKKSLPKFDRRRTLGSFKTEKPKDISTKVNKTLLKTLAPQKIIVCTNMSTGDKLIMQAAIAKLGGRVETEVTGRTTHVVSPNDERTMNVLRGVIRACTVVNPDWIHESLAQNKWLDPSSYRRDICDSNKVFERSLVGQNYKNLTFSHRGPFFLSLDTIDNVKKVEYLKEVVVLCGGVITENKAEAKIIISERPVPTTNSKQNVVTPTYIFDSAMKGICVETSRFAPKP